MVSRSLSPPGQKGMSSGSAHQARKKQRMTYPSGRKTWKSRVFHLMEKTQKNGSTHQAKKKWIWLSPWCQEHVVWMTHWQWIQNNRGRHQNQDVALNHYGPSILNHVLLSSMPQFFFFHIFTLYWMLILQSSHMRIQRKKWSNGHAPILPGYKTWFMYILMILES